jgi:hypothetical protein
VAVGPQSLIRRLAGRLQLAAIVPVRANLIFLRFRSVVGDLVRRRVVLSQGQAEN